MNAPLDPFAVLDAEIHNEHVPGFVADQLQTARDAFAELRQAAADYLQGEYHDPEVEFAVNYRARRRREADRLKAAIAATGSHA